MPSNVYFCIVLILEIFFFRSASLILEEERSIERIVRLQVNWKQYLH